MSVSSYGCYWSSSMTNITGLDLHFHLQSLNPSGSYNRGFGFQLRCLSE
ncbi:hypothetical protein [uncultured Rikenella sp.]|nr:hypothetical protein [uncultured Rikenella sp.]